jgi:hypothetical protein
MKPGWVRMRYTHEGVKVAWHPAAHPLSLPVPVAAAPNWPLEPVGEEQGTGRHYGKGWWCLRVGLS